MSKRAHDGEDSPSSKKPRIAGSATPSFVPPRDDLKPAPISDIVQQQIAAKRAEIQAKLAKFAPQPVAKPASSQAPAEPPKISEMQRRVEEAKRKVEEMAAKQRNANPYLKSAASGAGPSRFLTAADPSVKPGSALHPLLMDMASPAMAQSKKDKYKPMLPKFASTKANARVVAQQAPVVPQKPKDPLEIAQAPSIEEARKDPHFDRRLGLETLIPREKRRGRILRFNAKGKFTKIGDNLRQEAKMEALKQRIMEAARKAGLEDEMDADGGIGKKIKKAAPPEVEWWDAKFLAGDSYDDLDLPEAAATWESNCQDLVQHPIPIPAPSDKKQVPIKALMLTKKERKKMRRIRRAEAQRDHQDRVKMGLLPPDPPKVKLSNMMRVLTQDAIADPTKVEARVRNEMMQRKQKHEKMNEERKLSKEERKEKLEKKAHDEEKKGIFAAAYKVKYLSNPAHKFKVRKNAEQLFLTGVCLYTPKFALVIVEGAAAALKKYKRLMLNRIDWTEEISVVLDGTSADQDDPTGDSEEVKIDWSQNSCVLVWEGEQRERVFTNGFRPKSVPSDHLAREYLGSRAEGLFDAARKLDAASATV